MCKVHGVIKQLTLSHVAVTQCLFSNFNFTNVPRRISYVHVGFPNNGNFVGNGCSAICASSMII